MQQTAYVGGATSKSVLVRAFTPSTGEARTDLVYNTSGLVGKYKRQGANVGVSITFATLANDGSAWSSGGFVHIGGGLYRLDLPDAALIAGADWVGIELSGVTDCLITAATVEIGGSDPRAAALSSATIASAVADVDTSVHTTAGSLSKKLIDAAASAATAAGFGAPPTAAATANAVWDALTASHVTAGSMGLAMGSASAPTAHQNAVALLNYTFDSINSMTVHTFLQAMAALNFGTRVTATDGTSEVYARGVVTASGTFDATTRNRTAVNFSGLSAAA